MKKQGISLGESFGAVLSVVLVAILVIIAIYLFASLQTTFAGTTTGVVVTNESGYINSSGYTLDNADACQFDNPVITGTLNATDNSSIVLANATVSSVGVVTNATALVWDDALISYTYDWGSEACDAAEANVTAFAAYPILIGLVGTIVFLGLVIGVLVSSFVFRRKNRA